MSWDQYEAHFRAAAKRAHYPKEHLEACLSYAHPLYTSGVPVIYDLDHLSALVGYDRDYILGCSYAPERFYRRFTVPKRSGGERVIDEPLPSLKQIQRWVLDRILYAEPVSPYAKGFVPGRSIKENARFHRKRPLLLSLDIQDFFPSIKRPRIYGIFRGFGYTQEVANILARLCTRDECLPQGAPTSPALSNIFAKRLDRRLAGLARKLKARYTRYADDLAFSGMFSPGKVIKVVREVLAADELTLNEAKTRLMERHQRQEVTGVVVNERLRAARDLRRRLRQAIYYIDTYGLGSHLEHIKEFRGRYIYHLMGIATFALYLDPKDRDALHAIEVLRELLPDEHQISMKTPGFDG
jgi:RNA-directed DNA polymerase